MALTDGICCPHCGEKLNVEISSKLMESSRMSFAIRPNKGELLSARNVGGAIEQMDKLLAAIGREMGVKTAVLVEGMNFNEGAVTVELLVTRRDPKVHKRPSHREAT